MESTHFEPYVNKDLKLDLIAKQVVEGFIIGLHKSPFHGFSVEFAEHRIYNPGESVRSVDWKLFGRTEKLFVKKYEDETNLRCEIVLDRSSSMYFPNNPSQKSPLDIHNPNKIFFSVLSIASLIYLLHKQRDSFGLNIVSDQLESSFPCRNTYAHLNSLTAAMEKALRETPQKSKTSLTESLNNMAERFHKRSLVIIFSDLLDNMGDKENPAKLLAALQHLKHNKHEVILFHVLDHQKEIDLDFKNMPTHFVDLETGLERKVNPLQIRIPYQKSMWEFKNSFKEKCGQSGIDYVDADITEGYSKVLSSYLLKRSRLN